ncbi:MAG TPA: CHASE2 domain-containing protein [Planctomycetota bacterium]|nr:CHASE2 domain-containing protein [Planctomycetota bacterium]
MTPRSWYSRLLTALVVSLAVWALGELGALRAVDGIVYDRFMKLRSKVSAKPARVLLVEVEDPARATPKSLRDLLQKLRQLRAREIIFVFRPPPESLELQAEAEKAGNVMFSRMLVPDPYNRGQLLLEDAPELEPPSKLKWGIVHAPPATAGVYRSQHARFHIADSIHPAVEVSAAENLLGHLDAFEGPEYLIDFRGGPGSLPNVSMERVLSGGIIAEIVEGKCVLVGLRPPPPSQGLCTPMTERFESMSLLEYQGHALNTLLDQRPIEELLSPLRLVAVLSIAVLTSLIFQWFSVQFACWTTFGVLIAYGGASLAVFSWGRTWLPMTEVLLSQAGVFLLALRSSAVQLTVSMQSVISNASSHLRDMYWPAHSRTPEQSWPLIANMLNQTLDLNRLILLEADSRTNHVGEILALHCTIEDIAERRRDFTRPPYSDALGQRSPMKVKGFLRTKSSDEEQYLAPLIFGGDLLGFWAIGIEAAKVAAIPQFMNLLKDYSTRISELLHQTRKEGRKDSFLSFLRKKLGTECTSETYQQLNSTLEMMEQRLTTLDILINRLNSGIIVYDIFGRLLQINDIMLSFLKKENIAPFEMTALDLMLALSDLDISKSRRLLQRVIVENSPISFQVTFRSAANSRFLLHMRPLADEPESAAGGSTRRMGSRTVLCELVDTTTLTAVHEMKSRLTERLGLQLRGDLAAVDLSAAILKKNRLPHEDRSRVTGIIQARVKKSIQTLSECQQYLTLTSEGDDLERFPVDILRPLDAALEDVKVLAGSQRVEIVVQKPNFLSYVFASAPKLREFFAAVLRVLCQDAADNTTVLVRIAESEDVIALDFSNMGFGIPNELLQSYVFGDQQLASEEFLKIKAASKWIQAWGGMLETVSGVGLGIHFTVHFVKFI